MDADNHTYAIYYEQLKEKSALSWACTLHMQSLRICATSLHLSIYYVTLETT